MHDQPASLQDSCINYITENIDAICEVQTDVDTSQSKLVFRNREVFFPNTISDRILGSLSRKDLLTDRTLSLFDPNVTVLKRVSIEDAVLSVKGLRVLKGHKLTDLDAVDLKNVTVNDLIGCLGEWTLANLRRLNVTRTTFTNSAKFCVFVSLSRLKNLHILNVSNTGFNRHGLEMVAEDMPSLQSLDISCTAVTDIASLRKCKNRLKSLSLYNLSLDNSTDGICVLVELRALKHLDVSNELPPSVPIQFPTEKINLENLLILKNIFPDLVSLDISGTMDVTEKTLVWFLASHPKLIFLGLSLTSLCEIDRFADTESEQFQHQIKVSGEFTEVQIMEALRHYMARPGYVHKSLYNLFRLTKDILDVKLDWIQLIIPPMKRYFKNLGLQMAGTACLYNLTRGDLGNKIHPHYLKEVVSITLTAMETFPTHKQLQKNGLLTLCSDRILQSVTFDQQRCAKLVLDSLCDFDENSMTRMSVAICSILAAKIPTAETTRLGTCVRYMDKLLALVETRTCDVTMDVIMKFTLSALWNLTDESPGTCKVFIQRKGLELLFNTIDKFGRSASEDDKIQVQTKCLGLLNNIAEVRELRPALQVGTHVQLLRRLVMSDDIEISYFACGIMVHILIDGPEAWQARHTARSDVIADVLQAVARWKEPTNEMVAYRSFNPFKPLLFEEDCRAVTLWALWAIRHVCTRNQSRYCAMLKSEGIVGLLVDVQRRAYLSRGSTDDYGLRILGMVRDVLVLVPQVA